MRLTANRLEHLVEGDTVAIGGTATLEPAGEPGDKNFRPTHALDDKHNHPGANRAFELRRIDGNGALCVLIDSVQSQANRMEEALETLWADKQITLPVVSGDCSSVAPEMGCVTSLTSPHRVADALLHDSLLDGQLIRLSDIGKSFTDASTKNAMELFKAFPTGLIFGLWDSKGPKGGLGAKFERALVSEIVGINAVAGSETAGGIDTLNILRKAADIYVAADASERWTTDASKAKQDSGEPVKFGKEGKPSEVNHGNVTPTIDSVGGGVTIDDARYTVVLSLASLRRLRFTTGAEEARTVFSRALRTGA